MRNKCTFSFRIFLFVLLISLGSVTESFAQEFGIYEISSSNTAKANNKNGKVENRDRFYDLALNLQPTHYIENNNLKTVYGSGDPVNMTFEDSRSFGWLNSKGSKKGSVELLMIHLDTANDLQNSLDISDDKDFKNLKYVFIKCRFNCSQNDIEQFIKVDSKVRIFYTNQIGG